MRKRVLLSFLAVALAAFIAVGSAGAGSPPNRLDDNRLSGTPVELVTQVCHAILGPFQTAFSWFDLDVCPSMDPRIVPHPHIWNVYASGNWDGTHEPAASDAAINDLTRKIIDTTGGNNYLGPAGQYGIGAATFQGSSQNDGCTGAPSGTTNQLSIELWITCEVQAPGTGVPYPDDNTVYVIFLPKNVDINNGPLGGTCDNFTAYHLQSMALTVDGPHLSIPPFDVSWKSYPYAVIPLKCATVGNLGVTVDVDKLTDLMTHEIVEAATDPISLGGWVDNSTFDFSGDFLKKGEAADICENSGSAPDTRERRLDNGITVASYWSNADNACAPILHKLTLKTVGLPDGGQAKVTSMALFNDTAEHTVDLPKTFDIVDGAHVQWTFPSPSHEGGGVRYVTGSTGSDGVTFIDADVTSTAIYGKQYRLTVDTSPSSVTPPALTASQWVPAGQTVGITTDSYVPSGVDRYRFNGWSGDVSDIFESTNVLMNAPKTATANYKLQHQITFQQTGIPAAVPWSVKVDGTDHAGPYSQWFDEFDFVDFSFQNPVPALTAGTRYAFVSASATTPLFVLSTGPVTATYKTQQLLTVQTSGLPSPNLSTITNGGTTLGQANDTTPVATWIDDGTALALAGDADVNGVDGTQYFAQTFAPASPATLTAPFTTTLTYKTMKQLIQEALSGGGLSGPNAAGVGTALISQFDSVQAKMGGHQYAAALGELKAFASLVQAQCCAPKAGKAMSTATAKTLQLDAMLVYHAALCLGAAQLSAQQRADNYAYYSKLVSSLGGTVLPAC